MQMNPIEVHSYQQSSWQSFNSYQIKNEMEQPPLQQLVSFIQWFYSELKQILYGNSINEQIYQSLFCQKYLIYKNMGEIILS